MFKKGVTPELMRHLDIASSKHYLDYMLTNTNGGYHTFPCACYHLGKSCNSRLLEKMLNVILALLKINLPIHILPLVIFKIN